MSNLTLYDEEEQLGTFNSTHPSMPQQRLDAGLLSSPAVSTFHTALLELSNMAEQNSSLLLDEAKCMVEIIKHPLRY